MRHGIDTGFLVAAEVAEHPDHASARLKLAELLTAGDRFALAPQVLAEFIHIVTDPRRCSTDGIAMLDRLVARMPQRVYQARCTAVQKTRTWILRVAQAGGADAPISKTFLEPGSRDERIDIEIIAGSAFVP